MKSGPASSPTVPARWRRAAFPGRALLSLLVLAALLWHADAGRFFALWTALRWSWFLLGAALALLSVGCAGLVWRAVLPPEGPGLPAGMAIRCTLVGFSINAVLPASGLGGDLYRALAALQAPLSRTESAFSVVAARWCTFVALVASLWMGAALVPVLGPGLRLSASVALEPVLLGMASVMAGALLGGTGLLLAPQSPRFRRGDRAVVLGVRLADVSSRFAAYLRGLTAASASLGWALTALAVDAASVYAAARALGDVPHPLLLVALAPLLRVLQQVPGFVNGIGPQDVAAAVVWGATGLGLETCLAISFVLHAMRLLVALSGLPLYLLAPLGKASRPPIPDA